MRCEANEAGPAGSPAPETPEGRSALIAPAVAALLLAAPALLVVYLPMTDLPQHLATASIIANLDRPEYGFSEYYQLALHRSLYLLPYLILIWLAKLMPLALAMRCLVYLSLISGPLGILAVLRARGRPALYALLALPLAFNATFFWGFIHFNLALGMSFFALALLVRSRRSLASDLLLAAIVMLIALTHLYGLFLLWGYAVLWALLGERRELLRRLPPLVPGALATLFWIYYAWGAPKVDETRFPTLSERFKHFEDSILGGYQDWSETYLLAAFGAAFLFFAFPSLPFTPRRWFRLSIHDRILYLYLVLNLGLYMVLPINLPSAMCVHLRHSVLAAYLAPLVLPAFCLKRLYSLSKVLLWGIALGTIGNTWIHLFRFDSESESFNKVLAKIENRPRVLSYFWEYRGDVINYSPYLHYAAYIQAIKGGLISTTFIHFAWMSPVIEKKQAAIPPTPASYEWKPELYDYRAFGYYYDHVLVRAPAQWRPPPQNFPFDPVYEAPPWRLYRARQDPRKRPGKRSGG